MSKYNELDKKLKNFYNKKNNIEKVINGLKKRYEMIPNKNPNSEIVKKRIKNLLNDMSFLEEKLNDEEWIIEKSYDYINDLEKNYFLLLSD